MTRVLGIDTSLTSTGVCRVEVTARQDEMQPPDIRTTTIRTKPDPRQSYLAMAERIDHIADWVRVCLEGVDLAVIEGPSFASKGQHQHSRAWLWGAVYDTCRRAGVPVLVAAPAQRMKYVTGKGNADKDTVLAAAIKRWPDAPITGNDTADALILAAIGCRHAGVPIDEVPKANHEPVMAKLAG